MDYFFWLGILTLFAGAYGAVHYLHYDSALSVFFIYCTAFFVSFSLFLLTNTGKLFKKQAREAQDEIYKVVWPSLDDVIKTSVMIAIAVSIVGLALFGLDSILMNLYNLVL